MTKKTKKPKKPKIDKYFLKDNLRRFFLADMLRRKSCLKSITLEELDKLVYSINTLVANLEHYCKEGKMKIEVSDEHNWEGSTLFRDIILHNVLDIPITYGGSDEDFKNMLEKRWAEKPNQAKEMLKELEEE